MYLSTANAILPRHKKVMAWDQPFLFQMANDIIDLAPVIEKGAHTPPDACNQPAQYPTFHYSKHETYYQFDRDTYFHGLEFNGVWVKTIAA